MKRLVLVGAGHAHAIVLRELAQKWPDDVEVTLISSVTLAPYSGMVPGWLAGYYQWEECCIDFARLCHRSEVSMLVDTVISLNAAKKELNLASGKTIQYDWLSLNVGATLIPPEGNPSLLPVRPLSELRVRWEALQQRVVALPTDEQCRIVTVGGGAAGVETMLAVTHSLRQLAPHVSFSFALLTDRTTLLPGMAAGAARKLLGHLDTQHIEVFSCFRAVRVKADAVIAADGRSVAADALLWATGAQPYPWMKQSGLALDDNGFVAIDSTLRSRSHASVFATGDCSGWEPPLPKAGVISVRMGPVLAHNLLAAVAGRETHPYVPQRKSLALIGSGDGKAIAAWGALSLQGQWVWHWKQAIDRRFVSSFHKE